MPPSETDRHELTDNHQRAANYANAPAKPDIDGGNITSVYLSIKHPFEMEFDLTADQQSSLAKALTAAQGGVPNLDTSPRYPDHTARRIEQRRKPCMQKSWPSGNQSGQCWGNDPGSGTGGSRKPATGTPESRAWFGLSKVTDSRIWGTE